MVMLVLLLLPSSSSSSGPPARGSHFSPLPLPLRGSGRGGVRGRRALWGGHFYWWGGPLLLGWSFLLLGVVLWP